MGLHSHPVLFLDYFFFFRNKLVWTVTGLHVNYVPNDQFNRMFRKYLSVMPLMHLCANPVEEYLLAYMCV